jgi:hypothetical protein
MKVEIIMSPRMFSLIWVCFFLALLISCSMGNAGYQGVPTADTAVSEKEESFTAMLSIEEMNRIIRFLAPQEDFKSGACIDLVLENVSSKEIIFPPNYGLRIMTYANNRWADIENTMQYVPPGDRHLFSKGQDSPGLMFFAVCPNLANTNLPIELRTVIIGEIQSPSGTENNRVGAFIDITIQN